MHVWQDQCLSDSLSQVSDCQEHRYNLNFGEDYEEVLDDKDDITENKESIIIPKKIKRRRNSRSMQVNLYYFYKKSIILNMYSF